MKKKELCAAVGVIRKTLSDFESVRNAVDRDVDQRIRSVNVGLENLTTSHLSHKKRIEGIENEVRALADKMIQSLEEINKAVQSLTRKGRKR